MKKNDIPMHQDERLLHINYILNTALLYLITILLYYFLTKGTSLLLTYGILEGYQIKL